MIYGSLDTVEQFGYFGLGERFSVAFQYLQALRRRGEHIPGKTEIRGEEIWVNGICKAARAAEHVEFEYHKRYADIHWCLAGNERIEWHPDMNALEPSVAYKEKEDYGMLRGPLAQSLSLSGPYFAVLFPHEPHAPLIGDGTITKVCVKVEIPS